MQPTVGVLALQGDVAEHIHGLEAVGARTVLVRAASQLTQIDGLVIPGGESTTMMKLANAFDLAEPLRDYIAAGNPVYGSCAGMVLLAERLVDAPADQETLGGIAMTVRRNAFGRQVDSAETFLQPGDFGGEQPLPAVFIRAPWVESVDAADVMVLARWQTPACSLSPQALDKVVALRQGNAMATSFHPEISNDNRVHSYFVDIIRAHS